jgi:translation initiation factor 1
MGNDGWRRLLCPKCHQLKTTCNCTNEPSAPSKSTVVRVGRETKGRVGMGVTTVSDLPLDDTDLTELATKLKTRLGTGGTVKDGRVEIQGDQRDRMAMGTGPTLRSDDHSVDPLGRRRIGADPDPHRHNPCLGR